MLHGSGLAADTLVVRRIQQPGLGPLLRRLRANVRKHGPIFVPVRIALVLLAVARRVLPSRRDMGPLLAPLPAPGAIVESTDIHDEATLAQVRAWAPDLGLSIGAPILRPSLFGIPTRGTLNLHLGRVPEFRGAPPAFWELHTGARSIGATMHWVNAGLDTGPIVAEASAPLYDRDTLEDAEARAEELGTLVMREALDRVARDDAAGRPQDAGGATRRMPTLMTRFRLWARLAARRARATFLSPRWWLKSGVTLLALGAVRPFRDLARTVTGRQPVRLFNYHRVTELCRDGMTVSPRAFRAQIGYIARTHDIVPLAQALALLESGARLRRPVAVITFDDAYRSVAEHAAPVLAAHGAVATVYVSSQLAGTDRRFAHDDDNPVRAHLACMSWEEIAALCAAGWTVGAHTANHVRLSATHGVELEHEVRHPLAAFAARGLPHEQTLAYPFGQPGDISPEAIAVADAAQYRAIFSDFGGDNATGAGAPRVRRRIDIGGNHPTLAWRAKARGVPLDAPRQWFGG